MRFFHGFRIKEVLEAKYHLPVMALNDGKAAALAELATGHLQGVTNGAALVLGSGLGGGFIINGKLFQMCIRDRNKEEYSRLKEKLWIKLF